MNTPAEAIAWCDAVGGEHQVGDFGKAVAGKMDLDELSSGAAGIARSLGIDHVPVEEMAKEQIGLGAQMVLAVGLEGALGAVVERAFFAGVRFEQTRR